MGTGGLGNKRRVRKGEVRTGGRGMVVGGKVLGGGGSEGE